MANEETNCPGEQGLCRDCLKPLANSVERCPNCGSPRLASHLELHYLTIAHIDCDAFYAAIEKRDNPELASVPVIVGGGSRGVVSTCCYMARIRGVRSAMPMFKALAACPEAVVVRPDMEKYSRTGRAIRLLMQELTPLVEPLSIDEAFLDLRGTRSLHKASPATVLAAFAKRIESEFGLTISVGLSYCKFLAKIASDLDKPRGFAVIGKAEAYYFLRRQPVSTFWGVGKATQRMLSHDGITDISTVQDMEESELAKRYGSIGLRISKLSRGMDDRMVKPGSEAKSVSNEITFDADRSSLNELVPILRALSEKVSARLKDHHIAGQTITLKLKTADFKLKTRSRTLSDPTRLADRIFRNSRELLLREADGTKFRLLGIGVSHLRSDETADPEDLIDEDATRRAKAELAIDDLRTRFGNKAVELGYTFNTSRR